MTNYELWRTYTSRLHSPKQFLDAAFYYMIGAAMERRVWLGSGHAAVYANQYVLLCAKAGVGKGLAIGASKTLLDHLADPKNPEKPFLAKGPDGGSYEKLIARLADGVKTTNKDTTYLDSDDERRKKPPYAYSCLRLDLDELISFFHKESENAVKFFCTVWSGTSYERDTFSHGAKPLANPLLSFLAGATPDDMRELQKCNVIGSGLDRRMIIVYADRNEYEQFLIPEASPEALEAGTKLTEHIEKLAKICGKVVFSDEAKAYAHGLWIDRSKRNVSNAPLVESYNDNKQPQWQKYALAIHFAEGEPAEKLRTPISLETLQAAVRQLHSYELMRHLAYEKSANNELSVIALDIYRKLKRDGPMDQSEIIKHYFEKARIKDLDEVLEYLLLSGRITQTVTTFKAND